MKQLNIIFFIFCVKSSLFAFEEKTDTLSTIYLNNSIIISAQRHQTEVFDGPESVGYLDRKQLKSISPMSMPHALSYVPGVWMQKTNHGGGSAFVRGLTGYQTLLMMDGIRMNNSTYRSGPNQYLNTVDPMMISHVEVLRGTGSVQYGSDAIGGTIQLLSHDPVFSEDGLKIKGNIYGKYWSSDMEKTTRAQLNIGTQCIALAGGFTYKNLGDIKAGGQLGKLEPTGYDEYSFDFKGVYRIANRHQLTGAYQHLKQQDVPLYHKIDPGGYEQYQFDPQQRVLGYLRFESFYDHKLFSQIRYTASYQNSIEVRKKKKSGSVMHVTEEDYVNTLGANVDVISNINESWSATSGLEFYHDYVGSMATVQNLETGEYEELRGLYPDGSTYDNIAVFSMHRFDVNKWTINAGLRYNFIQLQLEDTTFGNTTIAPDALVGNIGVVYKISENHHLSALINSSFRAPNINDVSSFGIADFRFEVPAYDLKAETSLNKELGYKIRYKRFSAAVHFFHNKLNDLIANVPGDYNELDSLDGYKVYKRVNINEAAIYGGEVEFEAELAQSIIGFGNMSYVHGQNISKDEPMRRIPPLNGKIGLRFNIKSKVRFTWEYVYAAYQKRLSGGDIADDRIADGGTSGWNLVNFYGGYDHKFFTVNASLQNLFDEEYRVHGSGVDGIGRSFWISLMININP